MRVITHHGLAFGLDVEGWSDEAAEAEATKMLRDWVHQLDRDSAVTLHRDLAAFVAGADETPATLKARDAGTGIFLLATDKYDKTPDTGHHCAVVALLPA